MDVASAMLVLVPYRTGTVPYHAVPYHSAQRDTCAHTHTHMHTPHAHQSRIIIIHSHFPNIPSKSNSAHVVGAQLHTCCLRVIGLHLSQTRNIGPDGDGGRGGERIGATGGNLSAGSTFPDSHTGALDVVLSAKDASVGGVLGDFDLANQFTQGGTVAGSVLSGDANFLGTLSHGILIERCAMKGDVICVESVEREG